MSMHLNKIILFVASIVFLSVVLGKYSSVLYAEQAQETQAVGPRVGNKLLELQELAQAKNYSAAIDQAQDMLGWKNLTSYEKVQIFNFLAFANYRDENMDAALTAYEKLVAQGPAVPQGILESTLEILSKLYMQQGNNGRALKYTKQLFEVVAEPAADLFYLRAAIKYNARNFQSSGPDLVKAIDMVKAQGKVPKEDWLSLWNSTNYEAGDYRAMTRSLRELITYYPKDIYIMQLAGAYSQAGDTQKQLAIMDALYEAGINTDADFAKTVAMLHLQEEIPYRAAQILEQEINNGKLPADAENMTLIANAWFQARTDEKAVPALSKAADLSGDADIFLRLGMAHYNLDNFDLAIKSLQTAIEKGVEDHRAARQMIGLAYLEQDKYADARREFTVLGGTTGRNYLRYINVELERKEKLKQEIELKEFEQNELLRSFSGAETDASDEQG